MSFPAESTIVVSAEVVEARKPLIKQYKVPLDWIDALGVDRLKMLLSAIILAEQAGIDWREEWYDAGVAAVTVADEHFPDLERDSIKKVGRAATRAVAGDIRSGLAAS